MERIDPSPAAVVGVPDHGPGRLIRDTRSLKLQTVFIADEVIDYLKAHDEDYVLQCIQVAP